MHRRIAARFLAGDGEPVAKARANLAQWSADRQGQLAPAHREWMALLDRASAEELAALIASDDEEADRLRSSSPFAGVIDQRERIELWRQALARSGLVAAKVLRDRLAKTDIEDQRRALILSLIESDYT